MKRTIALAGMLGALTVGLAAPAAAQTAPAAKPAAPAKATKPAPKARAPAFKMVLEPRAMDLLKAMSERLASAKTLSFTAAAGFEFPSKLGPPIVYTTRYDVALQRPDKFRVLMPGDGPASEFYYDGKSMIAYAPAIVPVAISKPRPGGPCRLLSWGWSRGWAKWVNSGCPSPAKSCEWIRLTPPKPS